MNKELENGYRLSESGETISKPRPYDDAEYFFARMSKNRKYWLLIKAGEIKSRIDASIENAEAAVVKTLTAWNKEIEPIKAI